MDTNARIQQLIAEGKTQAEAFRTAMDEKVAYLTKNREGFRPNKVHKTK